VTFEIVDRKTGKKLKISNKVAEDFFGPLNGAKSIMMLPFASEVDMSGETVTNVYQVKKAGLKRKKVKETCVIRMGGIGDLLMLSSGLREMMARGETITLATLPQHILFMHHTDICPVISIEDTERYEFEKVIDLRFAVEPKELGNIGKSSWEDYTLKDRSDVFDELLGVYPARKRFELKAVDGYELEEITGAIGDEPFVAINASIVASARAIPMQYIEPLVKKIISKLGVPVVLFGVSQPWNYDLTKISMTGLINLIDKTDWKELLSLISMADTVVTPDTGSLHIAAAMKKKTLGLFGCINPRTRISYYPTVRALYPVGELPCVPCSDLHPCVTKPQDSVKCMQLLNPDRVVNAIRELGGY
jgi:hypothetical protein